MKKFLAAQLIVTSLLFSPTFALAIEKKAEARIASREAKQEQRLEARKEKMASREAAFKEKIQKFKDKKKAESVTKINERLAALNSKRVEVMTKHVDRMSEILLKLSAKSSSSEITQAQTAIDVAKSALTAQASQDYNIVVTSESKVGADATSAKKRLTEDLNATHQKVIDARKALTNAIEKVMVETGGSNGTK